MLEHGDKLKQGVDSADTAAHLFHQQIAPGLFSSPMAELVSLNDRRWENKGHHLGHWQAEHHLGQPRVHPKHTLKEAFDLGLAGGLSAKALMKTDGVFHLERLNAWSVTRRHERVRFIVLHSTEVAGDHEADARTIIGSWNSNGLRPYHDRRGNLHYYHTRSKGSQFVVDRNGVIYATCNPDDVTVHINDRLTRRRGLSNQNAIGIEMVHSGNQRYSASQMESVVRLVAYLQDHYKVGNSHVVTHGHIQPQTRRDPVNFDLQAFNKDKAKFRQHAHELYSQEHSFKYQKAR